MAQTDTQDFGSLLQTFMVDLDGDGVPDVQVQAPARERGVQVADARSKIAGGLAGIGTGAVGTLVDLKARGADSAAARLVDGWGQSQPQPPPSRGGVLDTLNLPQAGPAEARNPLMQGMDILGQAAGVADYYAMGIPSSMAGLVNAAIPGQPLGGLSEAKSAAAQARGAAAQTSIGRDILAAPEAFGGMGPYSLSSRGIPAIPTGGPARVLTEDIADSYNRASSGWARKAAEIEAESSRPVALPPPTGRLNAPDDNRKWVLQRAPDDLETQRWVSKENDPTAIALMEARARADRQAQDALRRQNDRPSPLALRQGKAEAIDEAAVDLGAKFPNEVTRITSDFPGFMQDLADATRTQPWEVLRAMRDKGYDLSGLTRAAFQGPRENGKFSPMNDETRAFWDMVRMDRNVLYRQRGAPHEPRNALMPVERKPGGND